MIHGLVLCYEVIAHHYMTFGSCGMELCPLTASVLLSLRRDVEYGGILCYCMLCTAPRSPWICVCMQVLYPLVLYYSHAVSSKVWGLAL